MFGVPNYIFIKYKENQHFENIYRVIAEDPPIFGEGVQGTKSSINIWSNIRRYWGSNENILYPS